MSAEAAVTFAERLATDEDFQRRAAEAMAGKDGEEATEAMVQFGAREGLEMTSSELLTIQQAMRSVELSDENLDAVAGGLSLSSIDLQNALQQQQQTLQMLSSISKSQHDTMKAIIQNLR